MMEFKLGLILTLIITTGSSAANSRIKRDIPECGSKISSLGVNSKIASNLSPEKDLGAFAALFKDGERKCGATLISPNFLLTAAHCVDNFNRNIKISLGPANNDKSYNSINTYDIKDVHIYEEYGKSRNKYHDIALLETDRTIEYNNEVWPYCLPEKHRQFENNDAVRIAGWGLINGDEQPPGLKQEYILIKDKPTCEASLKEFNRYGNYISDYPNGLQQSLLCAGGKGVDSCKGDSGGPMFYTSPKGSLTVIGIIASGIGTCPLSAVVPGFYTNVQYYLNWIYKTTRLQSPVLSEPLTAYSVVGLWDAAKNGDLNYVKGATSTRIDINWRNPSYNSSTALHAAAEANNHQIVRVLLDNGAHKNIRDSRGMTPLYVASWSGGRDAVNTLIEYSADVNISGNNGSSPLMVATWKGNINIVKVLLDANADTNASNLNGETALHSAAAFNRPNIAKLLLQKGINIMFKDKWGLTAEELAIEQGYNDVAREIRNALVNRRRFQHGPAARRTFHHGPSQN